MKYSMAFTKKNAKLLALNLDESARDIRFLTISTAIDIKKRRNIV